MNNNSEFINELAMGLRYSFNAKDLEIIMREVNKALSNYDVHKIDLFTLATVDDYNDELLKRYVVKKDMSGVSEGTLKQYVRETKKFLYAVDKRACDITTQDIENYLIAYKYQTNVSNTTLSNMRTYINNFFLFLFQEEVINRNPMDKVSKIKKDTIRDSAITKTEEEKLYTVCTNLRDRAILETLFATGCRVGELVNIKLGDINFYDKTIKVIGKGNKPRTVCISEKAIFHITKYLNSRNRDSEYLFIGRRKNVEKLSTDAIESMLKNLGKKANIKNIHPHRLRATCCTRLLDAGMDIQQVSKLLGHADIGTTMIYYRGSLNLSNDYNKLTNI